MLRALLRDRWAGKFGGALPRWAAALDTEGISADGLGWVTGMA